jgi:chromosome segregation ATPase
MGGIPNHTFSKQKGRELSPLEVRLDSVRRRLSTSGNRNGRQDQDGEAEKNLVSASHSDSMIRGGKPLTSNPDSQRAFSKMVKYGKHVEGMDDAEEEESGGSREREPIAHPKRIGNGSGSGSGSRDGPPDRERTRDGRENRRNQRQGESHTDHLVPFTQAANTTVRQLSEAQKAIQNLSEMYSTYARDIEHIQETKQKLFQLEDALEEKELKVKNQEITINTIFESTNNRDHELKKMEQDILKDRRALESERESIKVMKENAEKRSKAQEAELRHKLDQELKTLKAAQEKELHLEKQRLGQEREGLEKEFQRSLSNVQAEMAKVSEDLKKVTKQNEERENELEKAQKRIEELDRLKDSYQDDTRKLQARLEKMENEFGLGCQGVEFYLVSHSSWYAA